MADYPPYMVAYSSLPKILEKIKVAATPERFTQDFLMNTLGFKSGNQKLAIPFLKKIGFLGGDGIPTDIYKQFRNPSQSGIAMMKAIKHGYKSLYQKNEKIHEAKDDILVGLIVEVTGQEKGSTVVKSISGTFKALRDSAKLKDEIKEASVEPASAPMVPSANPIPQFSSEGIGMNLSYTINLNLPATTEIAVYDAIFKSLSSHLLKR